MTFNNNSAVLVGGAIRIADGSNIICEASSNVTFISNYVAKHDGGGAMLLTYNSKALFTENSMVTFNKNHTNYDGGAIHSSQIVMLPLKGTPR